MSLTKKSVVVITGAGSGIGRALAVRLSKEPISGIAISDVNQESLVETEKLIANTGPKITAHRVDVSKENEVSAYADTVKNEYWRVTHLINNAGVALGGTVGEVSLVDIRWLMGINFWGVV
ncbi:MAG: SDR family NAD(P)-dependent oxidoreductase, partial [Acidobacteria bacterium]|nr:SDR family NAD(P)-dependent oxidoreductase [Acidobacteriota bacterium]